MDKTSDSDQVRELEAPSSGGLVAEATDGHGHPQQDRYVLFAWPLGPSVDFAKRARVTGALVAS